MASKPRDRTLALASAALAIGVVLHGTDHAFVQDRGVGALSTEVIVGGTVNAALTALVVWATWTADRRAALISAFVGLYIAVGVTSAHILPEWSAFSDPYPDLTLSTYSWTVMLIEIGAAFVLGVLGLRALLRERAAASPAT